MAENDYTTAAMVLGIIAAILFIINAVFVIIAASAAGTAGSIYSTYGYGGAVASAVSTWLWIAAVLGILSGIMILVGAILVRNPAKRTMGGILMLVFGVVGIFGGGGVFFLGTLLAIIGGVLGLVSKPA